MENRKYLKLCGVLGVITVLSILLIPGFSDALETGMLLFLMVNARA